MNGTVFFYDATYVDARLRGHDELRHSLSRGREFLSYFNMFTLSPGGRGEGEGRYSDFFRPSLCQRGGLKKSLPHPTVIVVRRRGGDERGQLQGGKGGLGMSIFNFPGVSSSTHTSGKGSERSRPGDDGRGSLRFAGLRPPGSPRKSDGTPG